MESSLTTKRDKPVSPWLRVHPSLGISLMDYLFNKFEAMYPGKWRMNYPTEIAINNWRETWVEAFEEEGITHHQVKTGIRQCRKMYDDPPSLPRFLKACTYVEPQAHRAFQPSLTHKMTPEARRENLQKLRDISKELFEKVKA